MEYAIAILLIVILMLIFDLRIKKVRIQIDSNKIMDDIHFLIISDFHCNNEKLVLDNIKNEKIDAILIAGDLFDVKKHYNNVISLLEKLQDMYPIFFISGNHEHKCKWLNYEQIVTILKKYNVKIIDNKLVDYKGIELIGIKDYLFYKGENDLSSEKKNISELFKNSNKDKFNVVLIHRPDHYKLFNKNEVDCMISGHAHGGQWRIPGLVNGIYAPHQGILPKRAGGVYNLKNGKHIVCRGLAIYPHYLRLFNRPELIFLTIKKED